MKKVLTSLGIALMPVAALAQVDTTALRIVGTIGSIVSALVPIAFSLAVVYFFYGIAKYILSAGDAEKAKEGKSIMIYGAIAIFVMVSVFGIAQLIGSTFGIQPGTGATVPRIN